MEGWSRSQTSSSYADLHQRSQESYCSSSSGSTGLSERGWKRRPNRSSTSRNGAKSGGVGMDKDKYIEFLEREVFKGKSRSLEEKEKSSESESALHSKVDSLIEVQEEQSSQMKLEVDKTLALQEQRILENEKKLQTLASLVKTTQIFAEEQEQMMKQTLETSLSGVDERLKSIESSAAASEASSGNREEEEEGGETQIENSSHLSVLKSAKEEMKRLEERLQKDHQKQLAALNKKWEERTKAIEKKISEGYQEKLKQLEIKVASKLERVLLKVNASGKGSKTTSKKTKVGLKKKKAAKDDDEMGGVDECQEENNRKMQQQGLEHQNALTKYELASSLKDITRHMVEKILADRNGPQGAEEKKKKNLATPSNDTTENCNPTASELDEAKREKMGMMGSSKLPLPPKLGSSGGAALKGSNMMNQKRSKSSARNIPAKAEPSAKARKQKKAKEEHERRQQRLQNLYKEWTSLELESNHLLDQTA